MHRDCPFSNKEYGAFTQKIDNLIDTTKDIRRLLTRQNDRIRKLEVWRGWMTGAIAALGVAIGFIIKIIVK